ncbi:MFS transporter [Sediminitomix flava]|uniref:ACS family hexuronate transporter-like MFS transporter n=1 Tax=Sediminitomix flava TaxID=379075 RepID=A0A315ZHS0_SEDFL|nr:MFS transporter [Sediminitomix flava]PWJ44759.1 ACS family hexuronate transporter-like MFS transporter [Sediminitomix flava]
MKIKGLRWWITGLVSFATIINYIDRNALAIMWPTVSKDLGMTKDDYALLITAFMIFYALGQSVFGKLFDKIGTRMGFVTSILIWSISIGFHSVVKGITGLSILRGTLAFGEAGNWPGATKANAEWFPQKERATAQGLFNAGASAGAVISAPLIAILFGVFGWRNTFLFVSVLGALWMIPWLIFYKAAPKKHPWITQKEKEYILSGQIENEKLAEDDKGMTWLELFKMRKSWSVILSRFFLDPIWWLFVSWLPIYLADQFGFNVKEIGMFAWVPYVGAAVGSVSGGLLAGKLLRAGRDINFARKLPIVIGGAIMLPSLLATAYASTPLSAVLLIALILFGFQFAISNIQTLPSDFLSGKSVGSLAGLSGSAAVIGVLITTWIVPVITKDSYVPFFILGAVLVPLGLFSVFLSGDLNAQKEKQTSEKETALEAEID